MIDKLLRGDLTKGISPPAPPQKEQTARGKLQAVDDVLYGESLRGLHYEPDRILTLKTILRNVASLTTEIERLRAELETAVVGYSRQRHGASGLCCQLRLNEKQRADALSKQVTVMREAMEEIIETSRGTWDCSDHAGCIRIARTALSLCPEPEKESLG